MKILILSFTDPNKDPRVQRQFTTLNKNYDVTIAGTEKFTTGNQHIKLENVPGSLFERLLWGLLTIMRLPQAGYWGMARHRSILNVLKKNIRFDLIIANDLEPLPLCIKLKTKWKCKVIFDAHEWYPDQSINTLRHRLKAKWSMDICAHVLKNVDKVTTVSNGLAKLYKDNFNVDPVVIFNAPHFQDIKPSIHQLESTCIRMVHHGGANRNRQIENMINLASLLDDRFTLDLFLVSSDQAYLKELQALALKTKNVKLNAPWKPSEIVEQLNAYDVGLYYFLPTNKNLEINMPNKFFEFIQARLALIIGPGGEMAPLIAKYEIGIALANEPIENIAQQINGVQNKDIEKWKRNSNKAAADLSFKKSSVELLNLVKSLSEKTYRD